MLGIYFAFQGAHLLFLNYIVGPFTLSSIINILAWRAVLCVAILALTSRWSSMHVYLLKMVFCVFILYNCTAIILTHFTVSVVNWHIFKFNTMRSILKVFAFNVTWNRDLSITMRLYRSISLCVLYIFFAVAKPTVFLILSLRRHKCFSN